MKLKTAISIVSIILLNSFTFAQGVNPEQKMKEADQFYESGNISEAEKAYAQIIDEGYESSAVYYNLANCYYRMNNIGLSVYYFEKAKLLDPFDEDILYNAELAQLRIKNKPALIPDFAFMVFIKRFVRIMSANLWALISLLLFTGLLLFIYLYLKSISSRQKKIRFLCSVIFLFFSGLTFFFSQYQLSMINSDDIGIIISDQIEAKSSPDETANTLFSVYEGFKVEAVDELNGWTEIKLTDGKKAWVKSEHIKFL